MVATVISRTDLEDGKRDLDDIGLVVNGAPTAPDVVTRLGRTVKTLAKVMAEIDAIEETATESAGESAVSASVAESAAQVASSVATIARRMGPGAQTGTVFPGSVLNTYVFPAFECDGLLDAIDLFSMAAGASNIQFKLLTINNDGTANLDQELAPVIWSGTGLQTKNFGGVAFTKGQRLAVRRSATTSGTFSYLGNAHAGIVDTAAGNLVGNNNALTDGQSMPWFEIRFRETVKATDNRTRADRLAEAVGIDNVRDLTTRPQFRHGFTTPSANYASVANVLTPARVTEFAGNLKTLRLNVTTVGLFSFYVFSPDDAAGTTWTVERVIEKQISATGLITLTAGADFDTSFVGKGWRVGVAPSGGGGFGITTGLNNAVYYTVAQPVRRGQSVALTKNVGALLSFDISVETVTSSLADVIRNRGEYQRGSTAVVLECFAGASAPAGWTLNGWTISDGASSPAAVGWTAALLYTAGVPNATRRTARMLFALPSVSAAVKTGIVFQGSNSGGVILNCATNALELYSSDNGAGTAFTLRASVAIPFVTAPGTTAGRKYELQVKRKRSRVIATLWDRKTRESVVLDVNSSGQVGTLLKATDGIGPVHLAGTGAAGDVVVSQFDSIIDVASNPFMIVLGDSIGEGTNATDDEPRTWPEMIDDLRNKGDVLVCATGGHSTSNLIGYIDAILGPFTPKFVMIQIGVNDALDATWQANMVTIITKVLAKGAKPILCTYTPRADRPTIVTRNGIVRAKTFGNYPIIDVSDAVSDDDINQTAGMFGPDNVHPSTVGSLAISGRAVIDQPLLLDGSGA